MFYSTKVEDGKVLVVRFNDDDTEDAVIDSHGYKQGEEMVEGGLCEILNVWAEGRLSQLETPDEWDLDNTRYFVGEGWVGHIG